MAITPLLTLHTDVGPVAIRDDAPAGLLVQTTAGTRRYPARARAGPLESVAIALRTPLLTSLWRSAVQHCQVTMDVRAQADVDAAFGVAEQTPPTSAVVSRAYDAVAGAFAGAVDLAVFRLRVVEQLGWTELPRFVDESPAFAHACRAASAAALADACPELAGAVRIDATAVLTDLGYGPRRQIARSMSDLEIVHRRGASSLVRRGVWQSSAGVTHAPSAFGDALADPAVITAPCADAAIRPTLTLCSDPVIGGELAAPAHPPALAISSALRIVWIPGLHAHSSAQADVAIPLAWPVRLDTSPHDQITGPFLALLAAHGVVPSRRTPWLLVPAGPFDDASLATPLGEATLAELACMAHEQTTGMLSAQIHALTAAASGRSPDAAAWRAAVRATIAAHPASAQDTPDAGRAGDPPHLVLLR